MNITIKRHVITVEQPKVRDVIAGLARAINSGEEDSDPTTAATYKSIEEARAALNKMDRDIATIKPSSVGYHGEYEMLAITEEDDDGDFYAIDSILTPDTLNVYNGDSYHLENGAWIEDSEDDD